MYSPKLILINIILFLGFSVSAEGTSLEMFIKDKIPDASVKKLAVKDHFSEVYEIKFKQPLDHNNPKAGFFEHRIFLSHSDRKKPVVFVMEGYAASQTTYELSKILQSNQIIVEYRFNGGSRPNKIPWQYLNSEQAVEDLHRIRKIFKKFYKHKWVSTGISKGGTTALIYKSKYPKDVSAVVVYVAPLAFAQEDKRTDEHQKKTGSEKCRKKIDKFQRMVLQRRDEIIPYLGKYAQEKHLSFSLNPNVILEYAALEVPFSFWQWGGNCENIPTEKADAEHIFNYIDTIVNWSFYSDRTMDYFLPSFYEFKTELGYYGYPTENVKDLLISVKDPTGLIFAPQGVDSKYEPFLVEVYAYLMQKGDKIIYIYGELDTWTACGVTPSPKTDALKMTLKGGAHSTRINSFSKEEQEKIYNRLERWLKLDVDPL